FRAAWRWAEPDSANGASGPPGATYATLGSSGIRMINNNSQPYGGPTSCPWTTNKCGPNDEPFSLPRSRCNPPFPDRPPHPPGPPRWTSSPPPMEIINEPYHNNPLLSPSPARRGGENWLCPLSVSGRG